MDDKELVLVGGRPIAGWRIKERPNKAVPICREGDCQVHWTNLDGAPTEPGEGLILRCKICTLDCT